MEQHQEQGTDCEPPLDMRNAPGLETVVWRRYFRAPYAWYVTHRLQNRGLYGFQVGPRGPPEIGVLHLELGWKAKIPGMPVRDRHWYPRRAREIYDLALSYDQYARND